MFNGIIYNQGTIKNIKRNPKYIKGSLVIEVESNIKFKKGTVILASAGPGDTNLITLKLKYIIKELYKKDLVKSVMGGDNNDSEILLIPIDKLISKSFFK